MLYLAEQQDKIVGDSYKPLIDIWKLVQEDPEQLIRDYEVRWMCLQEELVELRARSSQSPNTRSRSRARKPEFYYQCRDEFNASQCPLAFNFLLRTCVNGIVRFNAKGEFNNSFHLSRDGMHPSRFSNNVWAWHQRLTGTKIFCSHYSDLLETCQQGDFVYLDPPYLGCSNRYKSPIDKNEFFGTLEDLSSRGIKWMVSLDGYSDHKSYDVEMIPQGLYAFHQYLSNGRGLTNAVLNSKEGSVYESVYTNYIPEQSSKGKRLSQLSLNINSKSA